MKSPVTTTRSGRSASARSTASSMNSGTDLGRAVQVGELDDAETVEFAAAGPAIGNCRGG